MQVRVVETARSEVLEDLRHGEYAVEFGVDEDRRLVGNQTEGPLVRAGTQGDDGQTSGPAGHGDTKGA